MAINFTELATAWGKLVGGLNEWNDGLGTTLSARVTDLRTVFDAVDPDLEDGLSSARASAVASGETWASYLGDRAVAALAAAVKADRPFADTSVTGLLNELQRQMLVAGESFDSTDMTCTVAVSAIGSPTGTPKIVTSDKDAYTGERGGYLVPDTILIEAQGNETYALTGNALVSPVTSPDWPGGNGLVTSVTSVDPATTSLGTDPGFDVWTNSTTLTNWETIAGTYAQNSTTPDGSAWSVRFIGTGGALGIRQLISVTPGSVLAVHFTARKTASPVNTGTLSVVLEDSSNTQLGTDAVTLAMSATTTSFAAQGGTLWVPTTATVGNVYLAFYFNGGVGDTILIDQLAAVEAPELVTAGPRIVIFEGVTATVPGDAWTMTVTADGTLTDSLLRGVDRLMGLAQYPVRLPADGSPTQADSLVS